MSDRKTKSLYVPTNLVSKPAFSSLTNSSLLIDDDPLNNSNLSLAKQTLGQHNEEEAERIKQWEQMSGSLNDNSRSQTSTAPKTPAPEKTSRTSQQDPPSIQNTVQTPPPLPTRIIDASTSVPTLAEDPLLPTDQLQLLPSPNVRRASAVLSPLVFSPWQSESIGGGGTFGSGASSARDPALTEAALADVAASVRELSARLQAEVVALSKLQGQAPLQTAAINSLRQQQERDRQWLSRVETSTGGLSQRVDDVASMLRALEERVDQVDSVLSARCVALERAVALQGAQLDEQAGIIIRLDKSVAAFATEREASQRLAEAVGAMQVDFAAERRTVSSLREGVMAMSTLWTAPLRCQFCAGCALSLDARNTRLHGTLQLQLDDPSGGALSNLSTMVTPLQQSPRKQWARQTSAAPRPERTEPETKRSNVFTFGMDRGSANANSSSTGFRDGADRMSLWLSTIDATIPSSAAPAPPAAQPAQPEQPARAESDQTYSPLVPFVVAKPVEHCLLCDLPHCADCAAYAHSTLPQRVARTGSSRSTRATVPSGSGITANHGIPANSGNPIQRVGSAAPFTSVLQPIAVNAAPSGDITAGLSHLQLPIPYAHTASDDVSAHPVSQPYGYGPAKLAVTATFNGSAVGTVTKLGLPNNPANYANGLASPTSLRTQSLTLTSTSPAPASPEAPLSPMRGGSAAGSYAYASAAASGEVAADTAVPRSGSRAQQRVPTGPTTEVTLQFTPASAHPLLPMWYYAPPYPHTWAGELWRHVHTLVKHHHARLEAIQRARLAALKTKLEAWASKVDARVAALARELKPVVQTHERMAARHHALLEALRAVHTQVMHVRKFEMSVSGAVAEELRQLSRSLSLQGAHEDQSGSSNALRAFAPRPRASPPSTAATGVETPRLSQRSSPETSRGRPDGDLGDFLGPAPSPRDGPVRMTTLSALNNALQSSDAVGQRRDPTMSSRATANQATTAPSSAIPGPRPTDGNPPRDNSVVARLEGVAQRLALVQAQVASNAAAEAENLAKTGGLSRRATARPSSSRSNAAVASGSPAATTAATAAAVRATMEQTMGRRNAENTPRAPAAAQLPPLGRNERAMSASVGSSRSDARGAARDQHWSPQRLSTYMEEE